MDQCELQGRFQARISAEGEEILKVTENGIEDVSEEEKAEKANKSRGR